MSLTDLMVCGAVLVGCVALALTVVRLAWAGRLAGGSALRPAARRRHRRRRRSGSAPPRRRRRAAVHGRTRPDVVLRRRDGQRVGGRRSL